MLRALLISCCLYAAPAAFAQAYYAQQTYPAPTSYPAPQVAENNIYAGQPAYGAEDYVAQPQAAPQPTYPQPRPSDAGQSVMTDIRQMNF